MNSGLNRFRDDIFTVYSKSEGLPSDEPTTVFQDRRGRIWVGFHDAGLLLFDPAGHKVYTTRNGLPSNEIFSIRDTGDGDLLVATREGLARMHDGRFTTYPLTIRWAGGSFSIRWRTAREGCGWPLRRALRNCSRPVPAR